MRRNSLLMLVGVAAAVTIVAVHPWSSPGSTSASSESSAPADAPRLQSASASASASASTASDLPAPGSAATSASVRPPSPSSSVLRRAAAAAVGAKSTPTPARAGATTAAARPSASPSIGARPTASAQATAAAHPAATSTPSPTPKPTAKPTPKPTPTPTTTPTSTPTPTQPAPGDPPAAHFGLSTWNLETPVGSGGAVDIITPKQLTAGFTSANFYGDAGPSMVFWAPVTGAKEGQAQFARAELRQLLPKQNASSWTAGADGGSHVENATVSMLQVPSDGRVVIGQLVDSDIVQPLVKVEYNNGSILATLRTSASNATYTNYTVTTGIPLNTRFSYQIQLLASDQLTVTANGQSRTFTLDSSFASTAFFFKAGDYPQDNVGPATEGGRVAFYALSVTPAD